MKIECINCEKEIAFSVDCKVIDGTWFCCDCVPMEVAEE